MGNSEPCAQFVFRVWTGAAERTKSWLKIFLRRSCSELTACLASAQQTGSFCHFPAFFPILFVPCFEERRYEGEVEPTEEGGFDIGADTHRRVSVVFAEPGNNLPLSQPTLWTLLHC